MSRLIAGFRAHLEAETSSTPLAIFRVGIGIAAFVKSWDWAYRGSRYDGEILTSPLLPSWAPAVDGALWPLFFGAYQLLAIALVIGIAPRAASLLLAGANLGAIYLAGLYNNHLAFLTALLVLLALADSAAAWSPRARRHGSRPLVPAWPITLLKVQLSVLYLFAGINKLNPVFWTGDPIVGVAQGAILWPQPGDEPLLLLYVTMGVSTIVWELAAPVALWIRGWPRAIAMGAGVVFHLGMMVTLSSSWLRVHGIGVFAIASLAAYVLFLEMDPGEHPRVSAESLRRWLGFGEPREVGQLERDANHSRMRRAHRGAA